MPQLARTRATASGLVFEDIHHSANSIDGNMGVLRLAVPDPPVKPLDLRDDEVLRCGPARCMAPPRKALGPPSWLGVDGLYVNTGQPDGQKVTRYIGAVQGPLGGTTWALNTDVVRNGIPNGPNGLVGSSSPCTPGAIPLANGTVGYELDYTNWDQIGGVGFGPFTVGMYLHNQSTYTSLAALYMDAAPQGRGGGLPNLPAWANGIMFNSATLVQDNTIIDGTDSTFSYQINGTHSVGFYDNSTSKYGLQVNGAHTAADIWLTDMAPEGLHVAGTHSVSDIFDEASGSPIGLNIAGTHTSAAISTAGDVTPIALSVKAGQTICLDGSNACVSYSTTAHKWYFTDENGVVVFSVAATTGNAIFKGTVTQSGTP